MIFLAALPIIEVIILIVHFWKVLQLVTYNFVFCRSCLFNYPPLFLYKCNKVLTTFLKISKTLINRNLKFITRFLVGTCCNNIRLLIAFSLKEILTKNNKISFYDHVSITLRHTLTSSCNKIDLYFVISRLCLQKFFFKAKIHYWIH